eukprot:UN22960
MSYKYEIFSFITEKLLYCYLYVLYLSPSKHLRITKYCSDFLN